MNAANAQKNFSPVIYNCPIHRLYDIQSCRRWAKSAVEKIIAQALILISGKIRSGTVSRMRDRSIVRFCWFYGKSFSNEVHESGGDIDDAEAIDSTREVRQ